jgi:hypothetical protein
MGRCVSAGSIRAWWLLTKYQHQALWRKDNYHGSFSRLERRDNRYRIR